MAGISVGIPMLFLDRQPHYNEPVNSKHGNIRGVACEALPNSEGVRKCKDEDFRPELTCKNRYLSDNEMTSDELLDYWDDLASNHKVQVKTKNGIRERGLREDAVIGFGMIIKPAGEEWDNLSIRRQHEFLKDSLEALEEVFKKYKVKVDVCYEHRDEKNIHAHLLGHDDDFRLSKKLGIAFFHDLNHGLYVEEMEKKGWKIKPKEQNYQEDIEKCTTIEEKLAYRKARKEQRAKTHGLSSKEYKAEKKMQEAEKKMQEAEKLIQEAQKQKKENEEERKFLDNYARELIAKEDSIDEKLEEDKKVLEENKKFAERLEKLEKMRHNQKQSIINQRMFGQ